MPFIPAGGFSAVLLQLGGGLVVFVPAAGAGCGIGPRPPVEAATEAAAECPRALGLDPAEPVVYLSVAIRPGSVRYRAAADQQVHHRKAVTVAGKSAPGGLECQARKRLR